MGIASSLENLIMMIIQNAISALVWFQCVIHSKIAGRSFGFGYKYTTRAANSPERSVLDITYDRIPPCYINMFLPSN